MLDILETEKKVIDSIITHCPSFDNTNIVLLPANTKELPKPYLGLQTLGISAVSDLHHYPIDEETGTRDVVQHYEWRLRLIAAADTDIHRQKLISPISLLQEVIIHLSTDTMISELFEQSISLRRVGDTRSIAQVLADEWIDRAYVDIIFGVVDTITETPSFIETADFSGTITSPDGSDPIDIP